MAKSQAARRSEAGQAKRNEIIDLLASMGKTHITDGREIKDLHLSELQELYKFGIGKGR